MSSPLLEALFERQAELAKYLAEHGEISFAADIEEVFPKVLVLAAASSFESRIHALIVHLYENATQHHPVMVAFVKKKALERQYHTFFTWSAHNANTFWSLFGEGFKTHAREAIEHDDDLSTSITAFLQLGSLRNALVHQDYATFVLERTAEEVMDLYRTASYFVDSLPALFASYPWDPEEPV